MKIKWILVLTLLAAALSMIIGSCSKDAPPVAVDKGGKSVTVKAVSAAPDTQNILNDPAWDNADETQIITGEEKTRSNSFGVGIVRTKAIQDGEYVYFHFVWKDDGRSEKPGFWEYDENGGTIWSQKLDSAGGIFVPGAGINLTHDLEKQRWENEDGLAILFDYGNNGSEGADCATTCHAIADTNTSGLQHFPTGGGNIDGWIWRAGRTAPLGIAEDQFWSLDAHNDSHTIDAYRRNGLSSNDITDPRWMHNLGRLYTGIYLYTADTITLDLIGQNWQNGDQVPGYVLEPNWNGGSVSAYDVRAKADYDSQSKRWTLVMWRKMVAPTPSEDVTFQTGHDMTVTIATMNHAMRRHSGSKVITLKF